MLSCTRGLCVAHMFESMLHEVIETAKSFFTLINVPTVRLIDFQCISSPVIQILEIFSI